MSRNSEILSFQVPQFKNMLCNPAIADKVFFPDEKKSADQKSGKEICKSCVHIKECFKWANDHREEHGTWGGETEQERRTRWKKEGTGKGRGSRKGNGVNYDRMPRVLELRAQGLANYLIAQSMGISVKSVERVLGLAFETGALPKALKPERVANNEKTHCNNGHEFTAENTYLVPQRGGTARHCRACRNQWRTAFRQGKTVAA